jgi:ribonuclease P protein component
MTFFHKWLGRLRQGAGGSARRCIGSESRKYGKKWHNRPGSAGLALARSSKIAQKRQAQLLTNENGSAIHRHQNFAARCDRRAALRTEKKSETDFSAQQPGTQAPPRLSLAHGNSGRTPHFGSASEKGSQAALRLIIPAPWPCKYIEREMTKNYEAGRQKKRSAFSFDQLAGELPPRPRKRREFLKIAAREHKIVTPGFILQIGDAHRDAGDKQSNIRIGYTASRKVGNAVHRNRVKRKLRELVRLVMAPRLNQAKDDSMVRDHISARDYVLVGRRAAIKRPLGAMAKDALWAIRQIEKPQQGNQQRASR